jgi:tetratricopeptide (TPR) repeat protein
MAATYRALGDFENARKYYLEALKTWEDLVGREHENYAVIASNYSVFLQTQGDYEQALEYANEALAIKLKIYGRKHQEMVIAHENLSSIHLASGNYELAIEHAEWALATSIGKFGVDSESTASAEVTLGSAYRAVGDLENAQKHIALAAELFTALSPDSTRAGDTINELALIQQAEGKYDFAHANFKRALSTYLKIYGDSHPYISVMHENIARNYADWGRYKEALSEIRRSVEIYRSIYGPTHKLTEDIVETCVGIAKLSDSPSEVCGVSHVRGRSQ